MERAKRFFMNGDEWGLYDVVPAENEAHCRRVTEEYRAHHKDTDFSPHGWSTPPYLVPGPEVPISVRGIRVADLDEILGAVMEKAAGVDTCEDFTGPPYPCPDCFAYAVSLEDYWRSQGFYGRQASDVVQTLHATPLTVPQPRVAAVADAIVRLGRQFDLLLFANAEHVIDLRDADAVAGIIDVGAVPGSDRESS